tara:strand:+ start:25852 stop:27636 length:1785 start_codon:yes stop_codon:yes gene_type:complete
MTFILGINAFHADASASLIKDGKVLNACEEERIKRVKHCTGFPLESIKWCISDAGISLDEIDYITINSDPKKHLSRKLFYTFLRKPNAKFIVDRFKNKQKRSSIKESFFKYFPDNSIKAKIIFVDHHLSHLASAYYSSPFKRSTVVSVDGFGDFASTAWGLGEECNLNIDDKVFFPHSLGIFYTAITQFLGFPNYGDEYKVMGLAPYGKPRYMNEMRELVSLKSNGKFSLNLKYFLHTKEFIPIKWANGAPILGDHYSSDFVKLFGRPRKKNERIDQKHKDIANSAQFMYEEALFNLLNHLYKLHYSENLCIAGGCGANSVANGKISQRTPFKNIYVQPAAGDAGGAIGSALELWHSISNKRCTPLTSSYLGHYFKKNQVEKFIKNRVLNEVKINNALNIEILTLGDKKIPDEKNLLNLICEFLKKGYVIGWFQGRMEWGPRALGHRSIISDPRNTNMQEILNKKIKKRESFRPFAPSVLKEEVENWFELNCQTDNNVPFMMKVYPIKTEKRKLIPAVCHVDGTGRLQTVTEKENGRYYRLIKTFFELTKVPMILNTSFNENEPIVSTIDEAFDCFARTKMDVLVIEDKVLIRK